MVWYALLLLGLLGAVAPAFAQQANHWYFGDQAGIRFSSGAPEVLLDGMMRSVEGAASISDAEGNLLFYTNGGPVQSSTPYRYGRVYDREHNVMPNGDLELSGGCNSAKQGALIVQDPSDDQHYYLFTLDCAEHGLVGGLRYSEVDMTLNGGLGDVTSIGNSLLSGVTESMIGIRHANGTDVWVLVHGVNNNQYHAFLVSATGITGPVTTSIGPTFDNQPGDMTVDLLSSRVHYAGSSHSSLLDFDASTGVLSNVLDLERTVFSCAFSPSGRYLYTCSFLENELIYQYDLEAADIVASELVVHSGGPHAQTALRLAPDGKIYVGHRNVDNLGVIHYPDSQGTACAVASIGLDLQDRKCQASLPVFVNDLLQPLPTAVTEVPLHMHPTCTVVGDALTIRFGNHTGPYTVHATNGALLLDGSLDHGLANASIAGLAAGFYVVHVASDTSRGTATFVVAR